MRDNHDLVGRPSIVCYCRPSDLRIRDDNIQGVPAMVVKVIKWIIIITLLLLVAETANNTTNTTVTNTTDITASYILNIMFNGPLTTLIQGLSSLFGSSININQGLLKIVKTLGGVMVYIASIVKEASGIIISGLKTVFDGVIVFGSTIVSVFATMALYIYYMNKYGYKLLLFFANYTTLILSIMIVSTLTVSVNKAVRTRDYEPLVKWAAMWYNFFKSFVKMLLTLINWIIKIAMIIKDYVMSAIKAVGAVAAGG